MIKEVELHPSERVDDLLTHGLGIIQSEEVFAFSLDAVLLARFCTVPTKGKIIDLCSGNGVIPLLLSTRTKAHITGVEIQDRLENMAQRSVTMNDLGEQIRMVHGDLRNVHHDLGHGQYDLVTVNPPYLPVPAGDQNENKHFTAARHEVHCTLEDVISTSAKLVRSRGKFAMVHRAARIVDIMTIMRKYRIEPKRVRFVHSRIDEEANMILIEGMKDGKPEVRMLPPLIVYNDDGRQYGPELEGVFCGKRESL
ncbi:tRNA1(Val) (adenine(37)-N6)-methyltransferase [Paenibacillus sp. KN14-4R]|uniref:tRNA1(Val) (adenine(37)-N6)-methyltransferase n=1 Tax=Paenibacillus sp. KN14-4R TaxID=3445773 RepID=UPI003FA0E32C